MKNTYAAKLAKRDVDAIHAGMKRLDSTSLEDALTTHPADILDAFKAFRAGILHERADLDDYTDTFLQMLSK